MTFNTVLEYSDNKIRKSFPKNIYGNLDLLCYDLVNLQQIIYQKINELQEASLSNKIQRCEIRVLYDINILVNRIKRKEKLTENEIEWSNKSLVKLTGHIIHTRDAYNKLEENDPKPKNSFIKLENEINNFKKILDTYKNVDSTLFNYEEAEIEWNKLSEKQKNKLIIGWETGIDKNGPNSLID
jgi:hypothetical protein